MSDKTIDLEKVRVQFSLKHIIAATVVVFAFGGFMTAIKRDLSAMREAHAERTPLIAQIPSISNSIAQISGRDIPEIKRSVARIEDAILSRPTARFGQ